MEPRPDAGARRHPEGVGGAQARRRSLAAPAGGPALTSVTAFAPAKVNLCLHVGPVGSDGYHPLRSLVVFADVGDRLTARLAADWSLVVGGPFGAGLAGDGNLILRALRALDCHPMALTLDKRLPVAAGLGGGSADAGAALRMARSLQPGIDPAHLVRAARAIGADGPMCLESRAVLAEGHGDRLTPLHDLPPLHALLVNPGIDCPTGAVYVAFDGRPAEPEIALPLRLPTEPKALLDALETTRNDLQAAAVSLRPSIGEVLGVLSGLRGARLVRMSGSGATCFALFEDAAQAVSAQASLARAHPGWWIADTILR